MREAEAVEGDERGSKWCDATTNRGRRNEEAVKTMREADALDRANSALADDIGNSAGGLGAENEMNDGESGVL